MKKLMRNTVQKYMLLCFSLPIFDIIDPLLEFFFFLSYPKILTKVYFLYTYSLVVLFLYYACLFIFYGFSYYPCGDCQICIFLFQLPLDLL